MSDQERKDFEAWAKQYGRIYLKTKPNFGRDGLMYENQFTQEAWVGWKARAALAQQAVPEGVCPSCGAGPDDGEAPQHESGCPAAPQASQGGSYAQDGDRQMLLSIMQELENSVWNCEHCGHAEDTKTMDVAYMLRSYLAAHQASQALQDLTENAESLGLYDEAAPQAEQQADACELVDNMCRLSVWWTHSRAKFTTPRQAAFAAWNEAFRAALAAQQAEREPLTADDLKEPKNGQAWRVEWWNEALRLMLPKDRELTGVQHYRNGTTVLTIRRPEGIGKEGA